MDFFKKKQVAMQVREDQHKQECDKQVNNFKHSINAYIVVDDERNKCETHLDFSKLDVVCIERLPYVNSDGTYGEKTIVGYKVTDGIKEYNLFISRQNHANLIKQYKEFIQKKEK